MCHGLRCSESTAEGMSKGKTVERKVSLETEHMKSSYITDVVWKEGRIRKHLHKDSTTFVFHKRNEGFGNDTRL